MLHFVHLRPWDIANSPIGQELKRLGVPHQFLGTPVNLRYRWRMELFLRIYPLLAVRLLAAAWASMWSARSSPSAVLVSSDIEAVMFGLIRSALRRPTLIVLQTLIITPRSSRWANLAYMAYWRLILGLIDVGVCHARSEIAEYERLFPAHGHKLVFIPYGTTVNRRSPSSAPPPPDDVPTIVTAGRSGRDYLTLARAVEGLPCRLTIICDVAGPLRTLPASEQIEIARTCFDHEYLDRLAQATIVVVPLSVHHASAGQMVLLQAAALARPVVITRTATTIDYATDGKDGLLVPMGDVATLRQTLAYLLGNAELRRLLGQAASDRFVRHHSTEAYVRNLVQIVQSRLGAAASGGRPGEGGSLPAHLGLEPFQPHANP